MHYNKQVDAIIERLQPGMEDYADSAEFMHWMEYACVLDTFTAINYSQGTDALVVELNKLMKENVSANWKHHAATDVASTMESILPEFKGVFVYE